MDGHEATPRLPALPKPDELLALHGVTAELFETLRSWFGVPGSVTLDLRAVDSAVEELGDPRLIAAMAMRKLQALHLLSRPGVRTTTDVVVTIVQDLQRALVQAPSMRVDVGAQATDWDEALAHLDQLGQAPASADADDLEVERFRALHALLLAAADAVIDVSQGEIRELL
jgi:hypothetical protein